MNPTPERTERTPRTDAHLKECLSDNRFRIEHMADFARQLETEPNEATAQNEALRGALLAADKAASQEDTFVSLGASYRVKHAIACGLNLFKTTPPAKA